MTRELVFGIVMFIIGGLGGIFQGSQWVQSKWDKTVRAEQSAIIEHQLKIKQLEREHQERESDIIRTFNKVKKDYENTIHSVTSAHSDSLLEHEARADYYRERYEQCDSGSASNRIIRLDRAVTEGIVLVEELEELVRFKEWQVKLLDDVISNDRSH